MKIRLISVLTLACSAVSWSLAAESVDVDWFRYDTPPSLYEVADHQFRNPVLPGYYPDPTIAKKGDDYYVVNSSFAYTPGLPVFHSKNLTDWELIGYALNRDSQASFEGLGISRGLFAPTLRYHEGVFYLINTAVDSGGNFILTATDPAGPWSEPVWLPEVGGIDPDIFFDDNGKAYIAHNDAPPGEPLYNGHRAIWLWEFDLASMKVRADSRKLLVNGGVNISEQPVWIEGPHIYKKNGWYYLTCAEGGTGPQHSQVVFRSRSLNEPFIPYQHNPILTQRNLPLPRPDAVDAAGHADFIEGPDGRWWSVFLGTRPYLNDWYNTGRETFLLPLEWQHDWPTILGSGKPIPVVLPKPYPNIQSKQSLFYRWRDDFSQPQLDLRWQGLRSFNRSWASIEDGRLQLLPQQAGLTSKGDVSYLGVHQSAAEYTVEASINVPDKAGVSGGIAAFQSEAFHYYFAVTHTTNGTMLFVERAVQGNTSTVARHQLDSKLTGALTLRVRGDKAHIYFDFYGPDGWTSLYDNTGTVLTPAMDATWLSTNKAGGFVGTTLGLHSRQD
ncbi:family 43 glycosylhydrolase [Alteromonas sp. AMM-1]|uniref:glycoside hydrolase family 43 protein n=1 Tax=Alteromonas sp. AMM-1 TaxID=3394233 RepID=UPI0039A74C3C